MSTPWIIGVVLLALAAFVAKQVVGFLSTGVAELVLVREHFFAATISQALSFDRDENPTLFWFTVIFYGAAAALVGGFGVWQFFR